MKGLITSILTVLTCAGLQAQSISGPKLVVGVTIDQLRTDYLEAFSSLYGERGFKRLWREGRIYQNAEYCFPKVDRSSAVSTINTGTTPSRHGIIANGWLDVASLQVISCVDDPAYMGNYTTQSSSAARLLCSTIGDELRVATQQKGLVYAIAPERDAAVLSAGHAGNGAFWINPYTGKWCSTTYYNEFPWWVNEVNEKESVDKKIDSLVWTPAYPVDRYVFLPEWRDQEFKYVFSDGRYRQYKKLIASPLVNDEVNLLTRRLLETSILGTDEVADFLSITYYAGNYDHKSVRECAMEMQDVYVRLDKNVGDLLDMLDTQFGLGNVLVYVTSTGYSDVEAQDSGIYRIPTGEFYLNRCAALLNMYLMAKYGTGQYVEGFYNQHIYLNHKLIEDKQLDLADVQKHAEEFLVQFSGVDDVYSANRLLCNAWSEDLQRVKNGFHRKNSGDLQIDVLPGWSVINEDISQKQTVVRYGMIPISVYFLGAGITAEKIEYPIVVEQIAPTVTKVLRIRSPNGAHVRPLNLR